MTRNTVRRLLVLSMFVVMPACSALEEPAEVVESEPIGDSAGEVLVFANELHTYLSSAADTAADRAEQFAEAVVAPITDHCIRDGEYAELARSLVSTPIVETAAAQVSIDRLDEQHLLRVLEDELDTLQRVLPGGSVTVCVVIAGDDLGRFIATQMNGTTGVTAGTGKVILIVDPPTVTDDALRYTLAHEYHHHWWTSQQATLEGGFTLLEYLLFEGRADMFAQLQHPHYVAPWTDQLTTQQIDGHWSEIQPQLGSRDPLLLQAVMFGGGGFPQWTGYATGNEIVRTFVEANPRLTIEDWSLIDANDMLPTSRFAGP